MSKQDHKKKSLLSEASKAISSALSDFEEPTEAEVAEIPSPREKVSQASRETLKKIKRQIKDLS